MKANRSWQAIVLGALLLLMQPAVQAKRPDADDRPRHQLSQSDSRTERGWQRERGGEPAPHYERGRGDGEQPRAEPRGRSLSDAVSEAERRTGGRVLSAEPRSDGGRSYYRVKVLGPDGRVQILNLDAR